MLPGRMCRITPDTDSYHFEVTDTADVSEEADSIPQARAAEHEDEAKQGKNCTQDPLRMFGFAVPNALRETQIQARGMLDLVSRLLSVDARMRKLEIEIRRARKKRGKALLEGNVEGGVGRDVVVE
ncbi:hypothetical protein BUE80_DR006221 [Diplocarpon rosae]|nr:hypothetical protein BUE80_DR006221 [Diplocarpon rosae]